MTKMDRYPFTAAACARPTPVLPLVGSTITPPGFRSPAASAASIIGSAMRSLTDPPGFMCSSFPTILGRTSAPSRSRATSGVSPTAAMTSGRIPGLSASGRLDLRVGGSRIGPALLNRLDHRRAPSTPVAVPEPCAGQDEADDPDPHRGRDAE